MTRIAGAWLEDERARGVLTLLTGAGHVAHFVGGCVRNALLGAPVGDIDIATNARPERVMALAEAAGMRAVGTGIAHGTVTLVNQGLACEVTTWRRDVTTDGRRAVVAYSDDLAEDARRRDFTMNALYSDAEGRVLDPLGTGLEDLRARRVRFIEDATTRIREDYLRILRFFRFHAWYGDQAAGPDPDALAAIASLTAGLEALSCERVGHEMLRLLAAPDPAPAVASMVQTGVLARVLPGADAHALPVLVHLERENDIAPEAIRRLAGLGRIEGVAALLRLSRRQARRLEEMLQGAESADSPEVLAWRHGTDMARDILLLRAALLAQPLPEGWRAALAYGAKQRFPVRAADLASLQGAELGARLRELEARWVESGFTLTREDLLE